MAAQCRRRGTPALGSAHRPGSLDVRVAMCRGLSSQVVFEGQLKPPIPTGGKSLPTFGPDIWAADSAPISFAFRARQICSVITG
jgi:hypothetical protein